MSVSITKQSLPVFHVITDSPVGHGTSYWGVNVTVDPQKLIDMLGDTKISDDYKISREWGFIHAPTGAVFTLYDWKETSLYDSCLPNPNEVWSGEKVCLHIGHKRDDRDTAWLLAELLSELAPVNGQLASGG